MRFASLPAFVRHLCLAVLLAMLVATAAPQAHAQTATPTVAQPCAPLLGRWTDYIVGNRTRMIQITCVAFGLGILILVTSTRKH